MKPLLGGIRFGIALFLVGASTLALGNGTVNAQLGQRLQGIGALLGQVGGAAHRDADRRRGQHRPVVQAVADHRDLAMLCGPRAQQANLAPLAIRHEVTPR